MKLSEVVAILEENPNKKFEGNKNEMPTLIAYVAHNCLSIESEQGETRLSVDLERDWQEVKTPVVFKEAIGALEEGIDVHCEVKEETYSYKTPRGRHHEILDTNENGISIEEILRGKWYID